MKKKKKKPNHKGQCLRGCVKTKKGKIEGHDQRWFEAVNEQSNVILF
jgi:hypothetical protein